MQKSKTLQKATTFFYLFLGFLLMQINKTILVKEESFKIIEKKTWSRKM